MKKLLPVLFFLLIGVYTASAQATYNLKFNQYTVVNASDITDTIKANDTIDLAVNYGLILSVVNTGPDTMPGGTIKMMHSLIASGANETKDDGKTLFDWLLPVMAPGASSTLTKTLQFTPGKYTVTDSFNIIIVWPTGDIIDKDLDTIDNDMEAKYYVTGKLAGIGNATAAIDFSCFPNPAVGTINLQMNEDVRNAVVNISDINGKVLYSQRIASATKGQKISLPVDGLSKGVYLLNLSSSKGSTVKQIIVGK